MGGRHRTVTEGGTGTVPAPSGKLDAAVAALTAAYTRGDLSADAFAAAVAALSPGS